MKRLVIMLCIAAHAQAVSFFDIFCLAQECQESVVVGAYNCGGCSKRGCGGCKKR